MVKGRESEIVEERTSGNLDQEGKERLRKRLKWRNLRSKRKDRRIGLLMIKEKRRTTQLI